VEAEKMEMEQATNNLKLLVKAQNLSRKTLSPRKHTVDPFTDQDSFSCFDLDKIHSDI
jgi:hypothetical protein